MFSSTNYSDDYSKAIDLAKKLREKVFLKTQMDVVYTHFSNWEREGLLYRCDENKGKWKSLSYVEYTWVKIVESLRQFGFSYDYIKKMKHLLFDEIDVIELKKGKIFNISDKNVSLIIKKYANQAGLDGYKYAGHSLRSGFATSTAESGAEERNIMAMTGHKSTQMVRRYIREANIFKNNALNKIKI